MYIGQNKSIKVKFYPENKSKDILSTPDHLPARTNSCPKEEQISQVVELDENSNHDAVEVTQDTSASTSSSTQKKFPVISEVIHIESY